MHLFSEIEFLIQIHLIKFLNFFIKYWNQFKKLYLMQLNYFFVKSFLLFVLFFDHTLDQH